MWLADQVNKDVLEGFELCSVFGLPCFRVICSLFFFLISLS